MLDVRRLVQFASALAILTAVLGSTVGCRDQQNEPLRPGSPGYPRTVDLGNGTSFEVPDLPTRIVCATTTAADYAVTLVPIRRILSVCSQARQSSILADSPESFAELRTFDRFVVETALDGTPDLILCSAFSNPSTVETLRRTEVPLLQLVEPATIEGCLQHLRTLGQVLDAVEVAEAEVAELRVRIERLRDEAPGLGRTVLSFSGSGVDGWASGRGTLQHDALTLLGFENVIGDRPGPVAVQLEDLLHLDPEFLIIPKSPDGQPSATRLGLEDERLRGLRALPDHVIEIDDALFQTTSHRIVDTCEAIARSLR